MTRLPSELERQVAERLSAILDERERTIAWATRRINQASGTTRHANWLGRKLSNETAITLGDVELICKALDIPPDWLLRSVDPWDTSDKVAS